MSDVIKGLGEVALQVNDLDRMIDFYQDIVGLPLLKRFDHAAFFKVADGIAGHTQVIALFDRTQSESAAPSPIAYRRPPLDHLAFGIELADYEAELNRLRSLSVEVRADTHNWVQWRSLYVTDPEGNFVEWVCFDPSIPQA